MTTNNSEEPTTYHDAIEKLVADGRAKSNFGHTVNQLEQTASVANLAVNWSDQAQLQDFVQFLVSELTALRTGMAVLALAVDDLAEKS